MKKLGGLFLGIACLVLLIVVIQAYLNKQSRKPNSLSLTKENITFAADQKTNHFVASQPAETDIYPGVPVSVAIQFNQPIVSQSSISIKKDGKEYITSPAYLQTNQGLVANMQQNAPDGTYTVSYFQCAKKDSCEKGTFQFAINSTKAKLFTSLLSKKEVDIQLTNHAFEIDKFIVARGTKILWKNADGRSYQLVTGPADSSFSNTAFLSRPLQKTGDYFAMIAQFPGVYVLHLKDDNSVTQTFIIQ